MPRKTPSNSLLKDEQHIKRRLVYVDQSHKQDNRATIKLADMLKEICVNNKLEEPLLFKGKPKDRVFEQNKKLFSRINVLVSLGTENDNSFSEKEINIIESYIKEGGKLLLSAYPPFKPPNKLLERFNVSFIASSINDPINHEGRHDDHILITDFVEHPINIGVKKIRFGNYGCYPIESENPQFTPLAYSSQDSKPPKAQVAALIKHGKGKIILIGQMRIFQDDYFNEQDNQLWLENILNYLVKDSIDESIDENQKSLINRCEKCGYELQEGDIFCGNCGNKITSDSTKTRETTLKTQLPQSTVQLKPVEEKQKKSIKKRKKKETEIKIPEKKDDSYSNSIKKVSADYSLDTALWDYAEFKSYSETFAWVISNHVKSLTGLTNSIVPYFYTTLAIQGNRWLVTPFRIGADVQNMLLRIVLLSNLDKSQAKIENIVKLDEIIVPKEEINRVKNQLESSIQTYIETKKALINLSNVSEPWLQFREELASLINSETIPNKDTLIKYEETRSTFLKNISLMKLNEKQTINIKKYVEISEKHPIQGYQKIINKKSYQWAFLAGLGSDPEKIQLTTDIERFLLPYFYLTKAIDESYKKVKNLIENYQEKRGFLSRSPDKNQILNALRDFNICCSTLYAPLWYFKAKIELIEELEGKYDEELITKFNNALQPNNLDNPKYIHEILIDIYNLISWMNETEPVLEGWGKLRL